MRPSPRMTFLNSRAADRHVALVAADLDLRPVLQRAALLVDAHDHRRLLAAVADGLDLAAGRRPTPAGTGCPRTVRRGNRCAGRSTSTGMRSASTTSLSCQTWALVRNCASSTSTQSQRAVRGDVGAHDDAAGRRRARTRCPRACRPIRDATMPAPARIVQLRRQDQHAHAALAVVVRATAAASWSCRRSSPR